MRRLPDHIEKIGAGFSGKNNVTADLIKREKNVAIYERSDGYYEVGIINASKGGDWEVWGKMRHFEAKENYFTNSIFGRDAWCCSVLETAEGYMGLLLASGDKAISETRLYTS